MGSDSLEDGSDYGDDVDTSKSLFHVNDVSPNNMCVLT